MEHKHVETPRGKLHYWIDKSTNQAADTIVFTHGLFCDHTLFKKQVSYFAGEYHTLTWDLPFHGLSGNYYGFSYANVIKDLKKILDKEQLSRVYLVGAAEGGFPMQLFADSYPELVKGLITIGSLPFGICFYSEFDHWYFYWNLTLFKAIPQRILKQWIVLSFAKHKAARTQIKSILKNYTKDQLLFQLKSIYRRFLKENKDLRFKVPVLLLAGEKDRTRKIVFYTTEWSKIGGYPLHTIENASHAACLDNPRAVNLEIETFIIKQKEEDRKRKSTWETFIDFQ